MKNQTMKITAIVFLALAIVSCKKAKNETVAKEAQEELVATAGAKYTADAEMSTISWKGTKPTGAHNGNIKISEGSLSLDDGTLLGGDFIIDMNSIVNSDIEKPEMNAKLVGHLKSDDFFNTEKHPFAAFSITGVEDKEGKTMIKGNLSVKGIKKNIEFPATVAVEGDVVTFKSEAFTIDRTDWEITYRSGKILGEVKDKLIHDNIELSFNVKATKATL